MTDEARTPGHEWKDATNVAVYLERQQEAGRQDVHGAAFQHLLTILPFRRDTALRFLDLGAGAGAFSAVLLDHFPGSTGVLADFSDAMMEQGSVQLEPFKGRYRYVELDMASGVWPAELAGPFNLVVSSRAIHHLFDDQKAVLFKNLFPAVAPGGVVANWDHIKRPASGYKPGSSHALTEATEETQLQILRDAGFADVHVAHRDGAVRGLFMGTKPA